MNKKWAKIIRISLIAAAVPATMLLLVIIIALTRLPSKKQLLNFKHATASLVVTEHGELIGKIFSENRTNIFYSGIPQNLINALIATEDIRFYKHRGIDTKSLFRVFFKTILLNKNTGGGSTITQQLAKNLFGRKYSGPLSILVIKAKESLLARRIEKVYSKEDILTLYLNTIPFGENVYGIEAASQRYFNKKVAALKIEESAVLIGMLKANNFYNPRLNPVNAVKRRNLVFSQMQKYDFIKKEEADSLKKLKLIIDYINLESAGPADYFIFQIKTEASAILDKIKRKDGKPWNIEEDGLVITTTLDLDLQKAALSAFHDHLSIMQKRLNAQYKSRSGSKYIDLLVKNELDKADLLDKANEIDLRLQFDWNGTITTPISMADSIRHDLQLLHAGLLAMDPKSGAIRAWIGGIDFKTNPYDQVYAHRQMGSVFKPILYAAAMESGIRPCYYLENDSVSFPEYDDWHPSNFENNYGGRYSLTGALIRSMNIPTVNLYLKTGFDPVNSLWKKLGFSFKLPNVPSVSLGTAEANIMEVTLAYAAFANGGSKVTPYQIVSIKSADGKILWKNQIKLDREIVLSDKTTKALNYMLQKAVNEGTGAAVRSVYGVSLPLAGKTGTTQDYADAWFASYNPSLVVVSRVGASSPLIRFRNSAYGAGSSLALPLVAKTLKKVQENTKARRQYGISFPAINEELENELSCPDFKESDFLEDFLDIFSREKSRRERSLEDSSGMKNQKRKRSFFRRLFQGD